MRSSEAMTVAEPSAEDLYENAPCGYLSATPGGTIVRVNATFERWTGYTRDELVGARRFQDLLTPGGRIYHETHLAPLLRMQGSVREIAAEIIRADGRRLPVLINSVLVTDDDGEPRVVRTTIIDATERKSYERELLAARNRERAAREEVQRLHEQTRDVSHTLQQSMLAGAPPIDSRFSVRTLYQPAIEHLEVGGDWHDAFALPSGRLGIVVGDVVGRGLTAATAMGQLRSAVRALAAAGHEPDAILHHLDTFVEDIESAQYATLVYAEVDPATGEVLLASAGHLPAILLDGEPRLFLGGRSTPLGLELVPRTQARFTVEPGGGFVLYTDGLVERRDEVIDKGLERLMAALRTDPGASPEELVAAVGSDAAGADDVCVLVFRRAGQRP